MCRISMLFISSAFFLGLILSAPCLAEGLPASMLEQVKQSQDWLSALKGKSTEIVKKDLGEPQVKENWEFQGKAQPLWKYTSENPRYNLLISFFNETVISASLQILSN